MSTIRRYFYRAAITLALALGLCAPLAFSGPVSAQTAADEVCSGIASASGSGCNGSNATLNNVIRNVINIFSVVIGIVAVVMIMVSGFKFITAGGDSGKVGSAKTTLTYAIVGLVIVGLAQAIVRFVLDATK